MCSFILPTLKFSTWKIIKVNKTNIVAMTIFCIVTSQSAFASISEPDNIYYGQVAVSGLALTASDTDYNVSVRLDDVELAEYQMGSSADGSDFYVLRVPIDSVGDRQPNYARKDDVLEFVVSDSSGVVLTASNMVYERGNVMRLDLGILDIDSDGVEDATDNCVNNANADQADDDGDGVGNVCDAFPSNPNESQDQDGDGMGDNFELSFGLNPNDSSDAETDLDGDGKSNRQEFEDSTDPTVADVAEEVQVPVPLWSMLLMLSSLIFVGLGNVRSRGKKSD